MRVFALCAVIGHLLAQNGAAIKAGDAAPELTWAKVVATGDPGSRKPPNLFGHITVLAFFPSVSANASLVAEWNNLVEKFPDRQVEFVWITSEKERTLKPWLENNPVRGWMLFDPTGETARAYGVEQSMSAGTIVDVNGRIAGFTFMIPDENQIKAVQEGHALAIKGDANDSQMNAILAGRAVRLDAEPQRWEAAEAKPDYPPSYELHISPTKTDGTSGSEGPGFRVQRGFDLPAMISEAYAKDPSRIVLPPSLDKKARYDFVLVPPQEMEDAEMRRLIQQGIEKHFRLSISLQPRMQDCYVMTVVEGHAPKPKSSDEGGFGMTSWSSEWTQLSAHADGPPTMEMLRKQMEDVDVSELPMSQISAARVTINDFRRYLELGLHRPIVDETNLKGTFDFAVKSNARSAEEFIQALRDQVGLLLTPAQRNIEMLVVTAR